MLPHVAISEVGFDDDSFMLFRVVSFFWETITLLNRALSALQDCLYSHTAITHCIKKGNIQSGIIKSL